MMTAKIEQKTEINANYVLGGVAFQQTAVGSGPYFLGEVNCRGNESTLFECPIGGDECDSQFTSGNAGVLCYNQISEYKRYSLKI